MTLPAPKNNWSFTNASGTTITDSVGGAQITIDRPSWRPGKFGQALRFNPRDGAMKVRTNLPDRATPWTVSLWVNREEQAANGSALLSSLTSALKLEQWDRAHVLGATTFSYGQAGVGGDCTYGGAIAKLGEWVHLTFVGTSTETRLYLNGQLAGADATSTPMPLGLDWIGSTRGAEEFASMLLGDIAVYDQALTAEQVAELHGNPQTGAGNPVGRPQIEVTESGQIVVANSTIILGSAVVGSNKNAYKTFTITNKGDGVLQVEKAVIATTPDYYLNAPGGLKKDLKKGEKVELYVYFEPKTMTTTAAQVHITSNDPAHGVYSFIVFGHLQAPKPQIEVGRAVGAGVYETVNPGSSQVVGSFPVGMAYVRQFYQIVNRGNVPLEVNQLQFEGSSSTFQLEPPSVPLKIEPGQLVQFSVTYAAQSIREDYVNVRIVTNDSTNGTFTFRLNARGIA